MVFELRGGRVVLVEAAVSLGEGSEIGEGAMKERVILFGPLAGGGGETVGVGGSGVGGVRGWLDVGIGHCERVL